MKAKETVCEALEHFPKPADSRKIRNRTVSGSFRGFSGLFISLICCVFLFSCKEKKSGDTQHKVISNYTEIKECFDSVYFKSSTLIKLETTDECLIKWIDKIMFDENRLFIFDKSLNSVFIFDMDGKFLHTVNRVGNGPGEYTRLDGVCLDVSKKQLILVPNSPHKIYYMDYDGNLLYEVERAGIWYRNINCHGNNIYAINTDASNAENDFCYIYTLDNEGKEKCLFKYPEIFRNNYSYGGAYMTKTGENLNFTIVCENFIYEIVNKQVLKKYEVDFGKHNLPEYYKRKDISSEEFFGAGADGYIYSIVEVVDGDNYLVFKTNIPSTYIYSKAEDLLTKIEYIRDSKYALVWSRIFHIENMPNSIAYIMDASLVLMCKDVKQFWESRNLEEQKQNLENLNETIQPDDNPVLMICNLR
jgi:hypothetical protein